MVADCDTLYGYEYIVDNQDGVGVFRLDCFNGYNKDSIDLALSDGEDISETTPYEGSGYDCSIVLPYTHSGVRHHLKEHSSIFIEGYISANSKLKLRVLRDYGGSGNIEEKEILGRREENDKLKFIKEPVDNISLGKAVFGSHGLSSDNPHIIPKFHRVSTFTLKPSYYEKQIQIHGDVFQQRWGILSISTNTGLASDTNWATTK
jgi:hypothetical protein